MARIKNLEIREMLKVNKVKWLEVCDYLGIRCKMQAYQRRCGTL
jgi:hypothetical protein